MLVVHGFPEEGQTIGVFEQRPVEGTHLSVVQANPSSQLLIGVLMHPSLASHEIELHKSVGSGTQVIAV